MVHLSTEPISEYMLYNMPNDFRIGFQLLEIMNNAVLNIFINTYHYHMKMAEWIFAKYVRNA